MFHGLKAAAQLVSLFAITWAGMANAEPAEIAYKMVVRVDVIGTTETSNFRQAGTGVRVGKRGHILTAGHVVGVGRKWRKGANGLDDRRIVVTMVDKNTGILRDQRPARVVAVNVRFDVALLKIRGRVAAGMGTCPDQKMTVGASLRLAGFTLTAREALRIRGGELNGEIDTDLGRRRVSATTNKGFSGGPVFVRDGDELLLLGIITGGEDIKYNIAVETMFSPLQELRGSLLANCPRKCRHSSHGVEKYSKLATWEVDSGWRGGGSDPTQFCASHKVAREKQFPNRRVRIVRTSERGRWVGLRQRQYRYHCWMIDEWEPIHILKLSKFCRTQTSQKHLPH